MSGYCTPKQLKSHAQMEDAEQASLDPQQTVGCTRQPRGNGAAAEDLRNYKPPKHEPKAGDTGTWGGFMTPGPATEVGLEAVSGWIQNGVDGEADSAGMQAARAIPGSLAMGAAMLLGRIADIPVNAAAMAHRGYESMTEK